MIKNSKELYEILTTFYPSIRKKKDESKFKSGSMRTFKHCLKSFLKREYDVDLNDDALIKSRTVFRNYIKQLTKEGLGTTVHYKDISSDDLKSVFLNLSPDTPVLHASDDLFWLPR